MHNDPELDRIVREAIDLGESSVIERALSPATSGIYMPLEDASELKASLLVRFLNSNRMLFVSAS